jgi:sugar/nucleoside kinase (ribokinase family)
MKKILAFGNPVYDLISTPDLIRSERILSGCSTNACLAASKMGEYAKLIGTVGPDFIARLRNDLQSWGIDYHLFQAEETGGFELLYDDRGDRELSILGIADNIPVYTDGLDDADFILFGPILGEITIEMAYHIKKSCSDTPILLDPQGLLRQVRDNSITHVLTNEYKEIAGLSTIVKANELETRIITSTNPRRNPDEAVKLLYDCGCKIAIVTLAEAGSVIYDGNSIYHIPPYTTNAIDPTGAGDTYAAGFMIRYLEVPDDLYSVGCFASSVASVMVENSGPAFPLTRTEAECRTKSLMNGDMRLKI